MFAGRFGRKETLKTVLAQRDDDGLASERSRCNKRLPAIAVTGKPFASELATERYTITAN